jgi:hypothetical protein
VVAPGAVVVVAPASAVVAAPPAVVVGRLVVAGAGSVVGGAACSGRGLAKPDGVAGGPDVGVDAAGEVVAVGAVPGVELPGVVPGVVLAGGTLPGVVVLDAPGSGAAKHWNTGRKVTMPATSTASRASL